MPGSTDAVKTWEATPAGLHQRPLPHVPSGGSCAEAEEALTSIFVYVRIPKLITIRYMRTLYTAWSVAFTWVWVRAAGHIISSNNTAI